MDLREWNHMEPVCLHTKEQIDHIKNILCCYGKIYWGRQTGWKPRPGTAGSSNGVHLSCKRRVTVIFFLKWLKSGPKLQKSRFQLFGFRKSDAFPPEADASLLANKFWTITTPQTWINPENAAFNPSQIHSDYRSLINSGQEGKGVCRQ